MNSIFLEDKRASYGCASAATKIVLINYTYGRMLKELIWVYPPNLPKWRDTIAKEFNIHPVTSQVLVSRGFKTLDAIHSYLYAKLPDLIDPSLIDNMHLATNRLLHALQRKETVLIYGDNDVDGIAGTALLVEFIQLLGGKVLYFIPNRNILSRHPLLDALEFANNHACKLLITVDCGVTAKKEVAAFTKKGIDTIITDHHEPTADLPACCAILNPKLPNSSYPNKGITGVGVAFKLAHAMTNFLVANNKINTTSIDLKRFLDLVALGTISDMGPLIGENRIFVRYGLKQLGKKNRIGLAKLMNQCEIHSTKISATDVAAKLAPRLNSLGRINDPKKGVQLLLLRDPKQAETLAKDLDHNNTERQKIERKATEEIEAMLKTDRKLLQHKMLILDSANWHPGIIPILAARLSKQYSRPTLVIGVTQDIGKGSLRTIPEFPLLNVLRENKENFIDFGGHDYAAGITIAKEKISRLRKKLLRMVDAQLCDEDLICKLHIDAKVTFEDLTFDFLESLHLLEPYGTDNPQPILYSEAKQTWNPKVVGKSHLKLYLQQKDRLLEGIGFGLADRRQELAKKSPIKFAFTPHINVFLNKSSIQLQVKDFQPLPPAD